MIKLNLDMAYELYNVDVVLITYHLSSCDLELSTEHISHNDEIIREI